MSGGWSDARTPQDKELFAALQSKDQGAFERALAAGGDPHSRDSAGQCLLHIAMTQHDVPRRFLSRLLELGIDTEARNDWGETPLHVAVYSGSERGVRMLLQAGADARAVASAGNTVFHRLSPSNSLPIAQRLHLAGADSERTNADDESPEAFHARWGQGYVIADFLDWRDRQHQCAPGLERPGAGAILMPDSPFCAPEVTLASWRRLPQALKAVRESGQDIPPERLLEVAVSASRHVVFPQVLKAMNRAGFHLREEALLDGGAWKQEALELVRDNGAAYLFSHANWRGGDDRSLGRVVAALPPEWREEVKNPSQLRVTLQQEATAGRSVRGR